MLLHCVAAEQRTPSVAVAYAVLLGYDAAQAQRDVAAVLPGNRGSGRVWEAAARVSATRDSAGRVAHRP